MAKIIVESINGVAILHVRSVAGLRKWLVTNHDQVKSVWLVIHHKNSEDYNFTHEEAVEQALCFGWIDSIARKRDATSKYQYFSPRKPKSNWSRINRERAGKMIREGQMEKPGFAVIEAAKKNGTWTALETVQNLEIPADLKKRFDKNKIAYRNFQNFPPSSKKIILEWILKAKKPETRVKRIEEAVRLAKDNIRANHRSK